LLSFGPFLIALFFSAILAIRTKMEPAVRKLLLVTTFLAAIPLVQNIVLLENSAEFSYERLKLVVPAAIVIAVALAFTRSAARIATMAMIVLSIIVSVWTYHEDNIYYARRKTMDAANSRFRDAVAMQPEYDCAALVTNVVTRAIPRCFLDVWFFTFGPCRMTTSNTHARRWQAPERARSSLSKGRFRISFRRSRICRSTRQRMLSQERKNTGSYLQIKFRLAHRRYRSMYIYSPTGPIAPQLFRNEFASTAQSLITMIQRSGLRTMETIIPVCQHEETSPRRSSLCLSDRNPNFWLLSDRR
jgi:hypothetical protein